VARILGLPVGSPELKRRIGYLPENPYFYDHLTAEELLQYFASLFGYAAAARRQRASRLLDEVGIGAERRLQLRKFSKGMLQRVGIAQALLNDPEVVFFDEPMSGLDPLGRREIRQLILRLRDRGCTVFFSSHVLSDAEALCNRVAVVARGRLVASGPLAEILAFKVHGWELVMSHVPPQALECALRDGRVTKALPLGEDRYGLDLPLDTPPEQLMADLRGAGAQLVSLNPLRETLEDFFVRQVAGAKTDRGLP
jgi:ABC-2 type transport system ATP-binding protein